MDKNIRKLRKKRTWNTVLCSTLSSYLLIFLFRQSHGSYRSPAPKLLAFVFSFFGLWPGVREPSTQQDWFKKWIKTTRRMPGCTGVESLNGLASDTSKLLYKKPGIRIQTFKKLSQEVKGLIDHGFLNYLYVQESMDRLTWQCAKKKMLIWRHNMFPGHFWAQIPQQIWRHLCVKSQNSCQFHAP